MKKNKKHSRTLLTFIFSAMVFFTLTVTMFIVGGIALFLSEIGILEKGYHYGRFLPLITFALTSIVTGTIVATIASFVPLKPAENLINGLKQLASGDYSVRLEKGKHHLIKGISDNFNLLADELENTEMLKSDFVNNFSHEFKTPIVSIKGFAALLQKEELSDKQREYVNIIVDEAGRLTDMSTNVLMLTKVENQSILTDVSRFNVSEQIRNCILLLERKWTAKNINIFIDFDEYYIEANEELLKQVWINILDNAIKFSYENGEIAIEIVDGKENISVNIKNQGPKIERENIKHIFSKYWQESTSNLTEGTGLGLSIAKRITELHKGMISVKSTKEETTFTVKLPLI